MRKEVATRRIEAFEEDHIILFVGNARSSGHNHHPLAMTQEIHCATYAVTVLDHGVYQYQFRIDIMRMISLNAYGTLVHYPLADDSYYLVIFPTYIDHRVR